MGTAVVSENTKRYLIIFIWLLIITVIEVITAFLPISKSFQVTIYILFTFLKLFLIAGYFMHLKHEKINFILTVSLPILFLFALLFGLFHEAGYWKILMN